MYVNTHYFNIQKHLPLNSQNEKILKFALQRNRVQICRTEIHISRLFSYYLFRIEKENSINTVDQGTGSSHLISFRQLSCFAFSCFTERFAYYEMCTLNSYNAFDVLIRPELRDAEQTAQFQFNKNPSTKRSIKYSEIQFTMYGIKVCIDGKTSMLSITKLLYINQQF